MLYSNRRELSRNNKNVFDSESELQSNLQVQKLPASEETFLSTDVLQSVRIARMKWKIREIWLTELIFTSTSAKI